MQLVVEHILPDSLPLRKSRHDRNKDGKEDVENDINQLREESGYKSTKSRRAFHRTTVEGTRVRNSMLTGRGRHCLVDR